MWGRDMMEDPELANQVELSGRKGKILAIAIDELALSQALFIAYLAQRGRRLNPNNPDARMRRLESQKSTTGA